MVIFNRIIVKKLKFQYIMLAKTKLLFALKKLLAKGKVV